MHSFHSVFFDNGVFPIGVVVPIKELSTDKCLVLRILCIRLIYEARLRIELRTQDYKSSIIPLNYRAIYFLLCYISL